MREEEPEMAHGHVLDARTGLVRPQQSWRYENVTTFSLTVKQKENMKMEWEVNLNFFFIKPFLDSWLKKY